MHKPVASRVGGLRDESLLSKLHTVRALVLQQCAKFWYYKDIYKIQDCIPIFPYQQWEWEREAHINWSMVTCQGSIRSELP